MCLVSNSPHKKRCREAWEIQNHEQTLLSSLQCKLRSHLLRKLFHGQDQVPVPDQRQQQMQQFQHRTSL